MTARKTAPVAKSSLRSRTIQGEVRSASDDDVKPLSASASASASSAAAAVPTRRARRRTRSCAKKPTIMSPVPGNTWPTKVPMRLVGVVWSMVGWRENDWPPVWLWRCGGVI